MRERIKLLNDVLTIADFFFVDQLPPYDPNELIPQKGDREMALKALTKAREVLAGIPADQFNHAHARRRAARRRPGSEAESRPDVPAHPGRRLRQEKRAAAI